MKLMELLALLGPKEWMSERIDEFMNQWESGFISCGEKRESWVVLSLSSLVGYGRWHRHSSAQRREQRKNKWMNVWSWRQKGREMKRKTTFCLALNEASLISFAFHETILLCEIVEWIKQMEEASCTPTIQFHFFSCTFSAMVKKRMRIDGLGPPFGGIKRLL